MEFYNEKLVSHRKQSHLTGGKISKIMGIGRTTYWKWEKGHSVPNNKQIRVLADILEISISDISDISNVNQENSIIKEGNYLNNVGSCLSFIDNEEKRNFKKVINDSLKATLSLSSKLEEAGFIIKSLLSGIDSTFYVKDKDLKYLLVNDNFLNNISLSIDYQVYGCSDSDFFTKVDSELNSMQDEKVLVTGTPLLTEGYIIGSRKKKWGIISKIPIFDSNGNVYCIIGNFVDITDRKKMENREHLLKLCVDAMHDGLVIQSPDMKNIIYYNKALLDMYGWDLKDLPEETEDLRYFWLNTCLHPIDRKNEKEYIEKLKWPKNRQFRIIRPNGEVRCLDSTITEVILDNSNCHLTIIRDITEQEKAEKQIHELVNSINKANDCIWYGEIIEDGKYDLKYVSKASEKIMGFLPHELIKEPAIWLNSVHPDYIDYVYEMRSKQAASNMSSTSFEYKITHRITGEDRWIKNTVYVEKKLIVGITRDITEKINKTNENKRLRDIIDISDEVVWYGTADKNNNLISMDYVNGAIYRITGIAIEEFMTCNGTVTLWKNIILNEDLEKFENWNKIGVLEYRIINQVTKKIVSLRAINHISGNIKYGIIRDITSLKKEKEKDLEREMVKTARKLKENNVDIKIISESTGLSEDLIKKI